MFIRIGGFGSFCCLDNVHVFVCRHCYGVVLFLSWSITATEWPCLVLVFSEIISIQQGDIRAWLWAPASSHCQELLYFFTVLNWIDFQQHYIIIKDSYLIPWVPGRHPKREDLSFNLWSPLSSYMKTLYNFFTRLPFDLCQGSLWTSVECPNSFLSLESHGKDRDLISSLCYPGSESYSLVSLSHSLKGLGYSVGLLKGTNEPFYPIQPFMTEDCLQYSASLAISCRLKLFGSLG